MATEKKPHIGMTQRLLRSFNPVIIYEGRPYTWNEDVDTNLGDLLSYKVEGDAIDDDHMRFKGDKDARGKRPSIDFDHAVPGPVKNAKLIISKDKVMGEQSEHVGVYTLATKEEFDKMKPKVKKQVTCENFLAHVGAVSAFAAAANDTISVAEVTEPEVGTDLAHDQASVDPDDVLELTSDMRIDLDDQEQAPGPGPA